MAMTNENTSGSNQPIGGPDDESLVDAGGFWAKRNSEVARPNTADAVPDGPHADHADPDAAGLTDQPDPAVPTASADRTDQPDHTDQPDLAEQAAQAAATDQTDQTASTDLTDQPDRTDQPDLTEQAASTALADLTDLAELADAMASTSDLENALRAALDDDWYTESEPPMLDGLLVANRGEIARRVFRSTHPQTKTIAVFSEPDRNAAHVRDADIAVALGGVTSTESYLDGAKVLDAAKRSGASAIHPGYGFLSENPDFAQAVMDAGLIWVGPTPESIRSMALKVEAKRIAERAGVPLVPGAEISPDASDQELIESATAVGFPLLVKASAGGGGKGMRAVGNADELLEAVAGARREAQNSFGDPTVFFERYLTGARHVEVQVFGDTHGNVVHLFERECSIQRRHQKIVEESPSPGATTATLDAMFTAAVSLAKEINYVGAGTVEFLVFGQGAHQEFYFLEMNTRLQVEHPVTEAVTGLDLVTWQLKVAVGDELPLTQDEITRDGHAIEVRLYAEDPANDYLPSTGTLVGFDYTPEPISAPPRAREELSAEEGDEVTPFYDPMIGKIITHAATRSEATRDLARNLRGRDIAGVTTNRDSLVAILESEPFAKGATPTDFLELHPELLSAPITSEAALESALIAASLAADLLAQSAAPWQALAFPGWSNIPVVPNRRDWLYNRSGDVVAKTVVTTYTGEGAGVVAVRDGEPAAGWTGSIGPTSGIDFRAEVMFFEELDDAGGGPASTDAPIAAWVELRVDLGGLLRTWIVTQASPNGDPVGDYVWVNDGADSFTFSRAARFADTDQAAVGGGPAAPVPGTIVAVEVSDGDSVVEGQTLIILEAMKMEHRITAAIDGTVEAVLVSVGQSVDAHQPLVTLAAPDAPDAQDDN